LLLAGALLLMSCQLEYARATGEPRVLFGGSLLLLLPARPLLLQLLHNKDGHQAPPLKTTLTDCMHVVCI
jgi:hypothetical protein